MAIDLDALEKLAARATPGPWEVGEFAGIHNGFEGVAMAYAGNSKMNENAAYIVEACNSAPELIAENRALQEKVRELERQREFFLRALNDNRLCPNGGCFHDGSDLDEWDCTSYDNRECWINAAKEDGE
jgi:hypothetical protein